MPRHSSTYIGIAFYTSKEFPMQWVIVLSSRQQFDGTVWCGTLIDSVNGRVESWRACEHSPATFAPYLSFLGIVMVGKVDRPASDIQGSIFNKVWKEQDSRRGKDQYPPTDEYVCWALLHLCNEKTITLPPLVKNNFSGHFAERLSKLRERSRSKVTQYLIIPIVEGDVVVGRTQV